MFKEINLIPLLIFLIILLYGLILHFHSKRRRNKSFINVNKKYLKNILLDLSRDMNNQSVLIGDINSIPILRIQKYQRENRWGLNVIILNNESDEQIKFPQIKVLLNKYVKDYREYNGNLLLDFGGNLEIINKFLLIYLNNGDSFNALFEKESAELFKIY